MDEVDKFMSKNEPQFRSKLTLHNAQIIKLLQNNYSVKQIREFLINSFKLSVSEKYLYRYIKKLKAKNDISKVEPKKQSEPKEEPKTEGPKKTTLEQILDAKKLQKNGEKSEEPKKEDDGYEYEDGVRIWKSKEPSMIDKWHMRKAEMKAAKEKEQEQK